MEVFGKSGASMVSVLKDGSAGLREMVEEGKNAAGNVEGISESMQKLNDASTRAKAAILGMLAEVASSSLFKTIIDGVSQISSEFIKWRKESKDDSQKKQIEDLESATRKYGLALAESLELEKANNDALAKGDKFGAGNTDARKKAAKEMEKFKEQKFQIEWNSDLSVLEQAQAALDGLISARNHLEQTGGSEYRIKLLKSEIKEAKESLRIYKEVEEQKKADLNPPATSPKTTDDSAQKAYAAETKRLQDWLKNYQDSKRTEQQIAKDSYAEQYKNLEELAKRDKAVAASLAEYKKQIAGDYTAKLKEIEDKASAELAKKEEAKLNKTLEFRRISAKSYSEIAKVEIDLIEVRYKKEIEMAADSGVKISDIEKAKQAELAAISEKTLENARQREDAMRGYRETAAQSEAERIAIQMEGINARYDAELEKAQYTADELVAIEAAKNAELERMEKQLAQMRQDMAMQQVDAYFQIANAAAVLGKDGGEAQKAIAISQAMINTALAATKAASAAPFPLNVPLVAGAVAQGAVQISTIKAQKFASGGMIPGANTLIMANEQGREAILNTRAVRAVGGEAGVNALNRGTSNTYNNSRSSTTNINISTSIMTQKTYRDEIQPVLRQAERRR